MLLKRNRFDNKQYNLESLLLLGDSGDYLSFPYDDRFPDTVASGTFFNESLSIEVLLRSNHAGAYTKIVQVGGTANCTHYIEIEGTGARVMIRYGMGTNGLYATVEGSINKDTVNHILATYNGSTKELSLYINEHLVATTIQGNTTNLDTAVGPGILIGATAAVTATEIGLVRLYSSVVAPRLDFVDASVSFEWDARTPLRDSGGIKAYDTSSRYNYKKVNSYKWTQSNGGDPSPTLINFDSTATSNGNGLLTLVSTVAGGAYSMYDITGYVAIAGTYRVVAALTSSGGVGLSLRYAFNNSIPTLVDISAAGPYTLDLTVAAPATSFKIGLQDTTGSNDGASIQITALEIWINNGIRYCFPLEGTVSGLSAAEVGLANKSTQVTIKDLYKKGNLASGLLFHNDYLTGINKTVAGALQRLEATGEPPFNSEPVPEAIQFTLTIECNPSRTDVSQAYYNIQYGSLFRVGFSKSGTTNFMNCSIYFDNSTAKIVRVLDTTLPSGLPPVRTTDLKIRVFQVVYSTSALELWLDGVLIATTTRPNIFSPTNIFSTDNIRIAVDRGPSIKSEIYLNKVLLAFGVWTYSQYINNQITDIISDINFNETGVETVVDRGNFGVLTYQTVDSSGVSYMPDDNLLPGGGAWLDKDTFYPSITQVLDCPAGFSINIPNFTFSSNPANSTVDTRGYTFIFISQLKGGGTYSNTTMISKRTNPSTINGDFDVRPPLGEPNQLVFSYRIASAERVRTISFTQPLGMGESLHVIIVTVPTILNGLQKVYLNGTRFRDDLNREAVFFSSLSESAAPVYLRNEASGSRAFQGYAVADLVYDRMLSNEEMSTFMSQLDPAAGAFNPMTISSLRTGLQLYYQYQQGSFYIDGLDIKIRNLAQNSMHGTIVGGLSGATELDKLTNLRAACIGINSIL